MNLFANNLVKVKIQTFLKPSSKCMLHYLAGAFIFGSTLSEQIPVVAIKCTGYIAQTSRLMPIEF